MTSGAFPSRWLIPVQDTSDDPDVFPYLAGQSFFDLKTPFWSTKTDMSVSGISRRRALWSYPIWKFKLNYDLLRDDPTRLELQRLFTFFNLHSGSYKAWFYYDRFDHDVLNQRFGTGDGTTLTFQLSRSVTIGTNVYTEPVRGVTGTPNIYVDGALTTFYTIGALGAITFLSPPSNSAVLSWDGQFLFLCNFLNDELDTQQMMQGFWSSSSLEFQSVKL